jgi:ribonuclease D
MTKKPKYLLLDTEFVREKTYFSKLCLVQVSGPGIEPTIIDPLEPTTEMEPLLDALNDPDVVKVLHSAYQDLEIFYHLTGKVPSPIFDTQVAASVLGYGEQVSYANLCKAICNVEISKAQQFTDWSKRPLSQAQIDYALGDVIYLKDIYLRLKEQLAERGREEWIAEDIARLSNPDTYHVHKDKVWEKIKMRSDKPRHLGVLKEIAGWREGEAIRRDMPKNFIMRDDTVMEIAMTMPKDKTALERVRGFQASQVNKPMGKAMLDAVHKIINADPDTLPKRKKKKSFPPQKGGILEMLKLLLKIEAAQNDMTPRRIADNDDLQEIALKGEKADVPAMRGWRYDIFGSKCVDLMEGRVGLSLKDGEIDISKVG